MQFRLNMFQHQRRAVGLANGFIEFARALHVIDDRAAGIACEYVAREQYHLSVGPDDVAIGRDHAEAIAVAIESETDVIAAAAHGINEFDEIFRFARIGVMIWKVSIDLAIEFGHVRAKASKQFRRVRPGDAVAAIDGDAHLAGEFDVAGYAIEIGAAHVRVADFSGDCRLRQIVLDQAPAQILDRIAGQGFPGDHDFQAVVVRRIVAAGDAHTGTGRQMMRRKIKYRRRRLADVEDVAAGARQSARQRLYQLGSGKTTVAPDGEAITVARSRLPANRVTDTLDKSGGKTFSDDAADVVSLEDFGRWDRGSGFMCGHGNLPVGE